MLSTLYPFSALLMILLPLGLGWFVIRRFVLSWRLFITGAVAFVLAQIFHIPINAGLTLAFRQGWLAQPAQTAIAAALIFGLTAALTAELARYFVLRFSLQEARSWGSALLFGAGFGGAEAILIGLAAGFAFVSLTMLRQNDSVFAGLSPAQLAQVQARLQMYWSAPWYSVFDDLLHVIAILCLQISYTVLVMQSFLSERLRWLIAALGWHWLAEFSTLYLSETNATGAILSVILALLGLAMILLLRTPEPAPTLVESS